MKILFISHLSGNISAGPCWSVPARIEAQSVIDDVYWINWGNAELQHWRDTKVFHKYTGSDCLKIEQLPFPFNHPDCVVFEGFYSVDSAKFARQLEKVNIPYIVNPRGSLTKQAMNNGSRWKKRIGHLLYFDRFVNNASAIQFLTRQEFEDSISGCSKHFILPNGYNTPSLKKASFAKDRINVVFIGRIDIYHKGLDLLVEASSAIADQLRNANVNFNIYGPLNSDADILNAMLLERNIEDLFTLKGEVSGKEKETVLLNADVFVLTSRFEGHPMGLIEALAYGLPVIVTIGSNMKEEIEKSNAGWSCETSVESIRDGLLQMVNDKETFKKKSFNARKLAGDYDWSVLAAQLHNELSKL